MPIIFGLAKMSKSNMLNVKELLELADQCAELANDASNREAKNVLQDICGQFMREADHLRRIACERERERHSLQPSLSCGADKSGLGTHLP